MSANGKAVELDIVSAHLAMAAAFPDREALVQGGRRLTWGDFELRTGRLGRYLTGRGLGCQVERSSLAGHQSGQDHVGIFLYNSVEYLESMIGTLRARTAPFNINYRYGDDELIHLLTDAGTRALIYHAAFAPTVARVVASLDHPVVLLQVADGSGHQLLPGAIDYEAALAEAPDGAREESSADDLFIIYTGGTTGMPKGVLWRQGDLFVSALGGRNFREGGREWTSIDEMVASAERGGYRSLPAAPFMHAAAQWMAFQTLHAGGTVVLPEHAERFDAHDVVRVIVDESVGVLQIVGDPFAVPLAEAIRQAPGPVPLKVLASGGTLLREETKAELVALVPGLKIRDTMGSSETGPQAQTTSADQGGTRRTFEPGPGACVIDADRTRLAEVNEIGWLATAGRVPLGYLGDAAKTAATFPVVEGRRMAVPGDRARALDDGSIEVLGRDSTTINTGGEKVYAQEVEGALIGHPAIDDLLVVGRPSQRWGQEVVAVVKLVPGGSLTLEEAGAYCEARLASYKKPRAIIVVDTIRRSDAGKADYRWAADTATAAEE
jgi:acyl-CoA synthetase (AMP-forming)/AMP-acid ligase II